LQPAPPKPRSKPATVRPSATARGTKPAPPPTQAEAAAAAPPEALDTGGGQGGNALNRNVKQAGILGALGLSGGVNLGAGEALAAVTNIDAVPSTRAGEAALQVGGLVGKLGSSRIEVPAVGLVNTKGSAQVVVSAGVDGGGRLAALEKGTTGKRQVQALVSADLKAPVSVQGGMSREEVKRVIDQHLDEVTYCYETALIEDAALLGKMTFEWRILETGRVGEVRIQSSSVRSETLHSCIRDRIRGWQFPKPRGAEVLVSYPFVFDVVGF
ncbi:MAG: AgmX/PglI C-terminal domain-containing protein, partial [Proteobacteria bacterium]|nr:AgmX/PglI C-terminal domain-containing protein [Pseudomonadota bacterium]